ncbi:hypothetical protein Ciccas_003237 [Cichlidogyrus casuarinus]|uniref:SAM domain-containing protein n=1 Tax=Cichlidogyrus casuarinus TaxID=1844966 RepID=A0ABD2QFV7_9PLAT
MTFPNQVLQPKGWKQTVRPEIRNWSSAKVAQWFKFRGLQAVTANMAGGLDGVMLSQLAAMRRSAPEAFHRSVKEDLGLGLLDCLKLLEALDDLSPDGMDDEQSSNKAQNGATESSRGDDGDDACERYSNFSAHDTQHRMHNNGQRIADNYHM